MSAPVDVLAVFDAAEVNAELAHRQIDAIQARKARAAVVELIAALTEIADFDGNPQTPILNSVKKSGIARAALARCGGA